VVVEAVEDEDEDEEEGDGIILTRKRTRTRLTKRSPLMTHPQTIREEEAALLVEAGLPTAGEVPENHVQDAATTSRRSTTLTIKTIMTLMVRTERTRTRTRSPPPPPPLSHRKKTVTTTTTTRCTLWTVLRKALPTSLQLLLMLLLLTMTMVVMSNCKSHLVLRRLPQHVPIIRIIPAPNRCPLLLHHRRRPFPSLQNMLLLQTHGPGHGHGRLEFP
jgi:hypothetical protein